MKDNLLMFIAGGVVGALLIGIALGLILDTTLDEARAQELVQRQHAYMVGLTTGGVFKRDYELWSAAGKPPNDLRGQPDHRCALRYYPEEQDSFSGCLAALKEPPPATFNLPR